MTTFIKIDEPTPPRAGASSFALWELGFRPFYLLASSFAALSVGLWSLQFTGWLPTPYLPAPLWHAHEMLMGFALAVIVGFLFTAGRNWTGRPTPTGGALMALAALWLLARVLVLTPFGLASALANLAFPVASAAALAVPLWKARSKRNYFFVALLLGLGAASLGIHLAQLKLLPQVGAYAVQMALDVVLFVLCVMGGRVIPMFTNNGVPGARAQRKDWLEKGALGAVLALMLADALRLPAAWVAVAAAVAGALHLARLVLWQPWVTWRTPLVWVLHLAYAWIPLHLALRAMTALGLAGPSAAHHALTVGAVGGLVIGMMVRTARGHTARRLMADRWEVSCFVLVAASALARVLLPLAAPALTLEAVGISAALWSLGFALYTLRYWPVLTRPRLDGKPG